MRVASKPRKVSKLLDISVFFGRILSQPFPGLQCVSEKIKAKNSADGSDKKLTKKGRSCKNGCLLEAQTAPDIFCGDLGGHNKSQHNGLPSSLAFVPKDRCCRIMTLSFSSTLSKSIFSREKLTNHRKKGEPFSQV